MGSSEDGGDGEVESDGAAAVERKSRRGVKS